jgi:ABC-type phosphate/phosphonate transport system substrate-binding protein
MSRTLLLAALVAAAAAGQASAATPMPSVLHIAYQASATAACAAPGTSTPPAPAALAKHLAGRLQMPVQLCPFADPAAAAAALAQGRVDFASLTPAAWPAAKGKARPILTVRPEGGLPRTPILAIAKKSVGKLDAAAVAQRRVIAIKRDPLYYDEALAAVATRGGAAIAKAPTPLAGSFDAAIAAIATGKADVALMPGEQWQAGCAADKPLCAPYEVAWQDRPVAGSAWVLRAGLPDELRYRLIGIFLPMHLENPQAYAGASGGVKGGFEPTEATALDGSAGR